MLADPTWQGLLWTWGPTLLLVGTGVYLLVRREGGRPAERRPEEATVQPAPSMSAAQVSTTRAETDPAELGRRLYVGRVEVHIYALSTDRLLHVRLFGFNGADVPLRLVRLGGVVSYGKNSGVPDAELVWLPTPKVGRGTDKELAALSKFRVFIEQPVQPELAAEMEEQFAAGEAVMFGFDRLDVEVASGSAAKSARLPVWDRATCERVGTRTLVLEKQVLTMVGFRG